MRNFASVVLLATVVVLGQSQAGAGETGPLPVRDVGARQGQAIGSAIVCSGVHMTKKAEDLGSAYSGANLDAFNVESAKVVKVWRDLLTCDRAARPIYCRVVHMTWCRRAVWEIGANGTRLPGLIEVPN